MTIGSRMANRLTCEDVLKIDLAEPCIRALIDLRRSKAGTLYWSECGIDIAAVGLDWRHLARRLNITATVDGETMTQTIAVTTTRPFFGGARAWFSCPQTGERARMLCFIPGERQWKSRGASAVSYSSQRLTPAFRRLATMVARCHRNARRQAMRRQNRRQR